jgi:hypothetical protein
VKNLRLLIVFLAVQVAGIACSWFWQHPYSASSSFLWGTGFLALLPGDVLGTQIVQSVLWHSRLTLGTMSVLALVLGVAINAVVWFLLATIFRSILGRRSGPKAH